MIINRVDDEHAVVELQEGLFANMPKSLLPNLAEEGDVISIEIDEEETDRRKKRLEEINQHL